MKLFLNFVQFALPPDIVVPEFFLSRLQLLEELLFAEKSLPAQNGLCEAFNLILFLRWVHLFQGNLDTGLIQLIQGLVQATVIAAAFVLLVAGCLRPISQVEIVVEHPSFELLSKLSYRGESMQKRMLDACSSRVRTKLGVHACAKDNNFLCVRQVAEAGVCVCLRASDR